MKKILILTAGFGDGHNSAARGILEAAAAVENGGAGARVIDLFDVCHRRLNGVSKRAYLALINHAPELWSSIYRLLDTTRLFELNLCMMSKMRRSLADLIDRERPHVVVSTYPVYNHLLNGIYGENGTRPFLQATIVTDSISVNSIWHRASCDCFIVPNEETAAVMRAAKVSPDKIKVLGFPVAPCFASNPLDREPPSGTAGRRVLYMVNAWKGKAAQIVHALLNIPDIELTVTVGQDRRLQSKIEGIVRASGRNARVFGWTERLPEFMMSHHLVISKAGGATVQEAIAARTPMIIQHVVPGQEEGNARLLTDNDCGVVARSGADLADAVAGAFEKEGARWHRWEANIGKLSRPAAAHDIVRYLLTAKPA